MLFLGPLVLLGLLAAVLVWVVGLYNGLVLLIDDETHTYWDHITGEAVHGPRRGERLEAWNLPLTTGERALADEPWLRLARSRPGFFARLFGRMHMTRLFGRGLIPILRHGAREPQKGDRSGAKRSESLQ